MIRSRVLKNFFKIKVAVTGLIIISLIFIIALLAYVIAPDNTPYANGQQITLGNIKPGKVITFLNIKRNKITDSESWIYKFMHGFPSAYNRIPINNCEVNGDSIFIEEYGSTSKTKFQNSFHLADIFYAIQGERTIKKKSGNYIIPIVNGKHKTVSISKLKAQIPEEAIKQQTFWLGTDRFGRDMLSRIIVGSRISISVGFIAVGISLFVGIILGLLGGYYGGIVDKLIMWLINVVWSIPTLLLVIAISMVLGKGFWQIFLAVGLTMWVEVARVVRGQVKSLKEKDFVLSARVLGISGSRIMFRHILPNTTGPLIVISAANFATAILLEAGLSFLGIGVQPPMPSWGNMIRDHYGYIVVDQAYLAIVPGGAIMLMVWSFNVLGYGLRDAFDVKN